MAYYKAVNPVSHAADLPYRDGDSEISGDIFVVSLLCSSNRMLNNANVVRVSGSESGT